ncbi:hypothetical protein ACFX2I_026421 [Malus domestica]
MKISTGFLVLLLCASFVHGECPIDSSKLKKNIVVPILGSLLSTMALDDSEGSYQSDDGTFHVSMIYLLTVVGTWSIY